MQNLQQSALDYEGLSMVTTVQSTNHKKIPARNFIYVHAQHYAMSDELLLAILKAFVPQVKRQTIGFHMFKYT
jgi:hypothetical protein